MRMVFMIVLMCLVPTSVMAQVALPTELVEVDTADALMFLLQSLGGIKGASTLAIVVLVSQLLMKFVATPLLKLDGAMKLLIISGLTIVGGVAGLMIQTGIDLGAALMHSSILAALSTYVHQLYKQFIVKK